MLKKIILIPLILLSINAFSQVGIKGGFAFGVWTNQNVNSRFYPGFDLGVTYGFTENLRGEILYEGLFHGSNNGAFKSTSWLMPVTVGVDYSFTNNSIRPFVGLNIGYYNAGGSTHFAGSTTTASNSYFGMFPKAGLNYEITDNLLLDVTLKYHMFFVNNAVASNRTRMLFGMNVGIIYQL